jgi:hypothetical protein
MLVFVLSLGMFITAELLPVLTVFLTGGDKWDTPVTDMTAEELQEIIKFVEETTGPLE